MAPHSSTVAWKISWTEEPSGLQSMGSLRVWHDWETFFSLFTFMNWRRKWQPTPCSCLENPRDAGAWWASIHGVAQSQTQLSDLAAAAAVEKEWALITVLVQLLSCVWVFVTLWTIACQASLSSIIFWSLLKLMSIELVMPFNHLILCHPVLLPSIFPSIRVFSKESAFPLGRQSIGASTSTSVLPENNRIDFLKDCLVWSLCCPRDSQEYSPAL